MTTTQKKTLLQVAQGNAETKACETVFFLPLKKRNSKISPQRFKKKIKNPNTQC